MHRGLQLLLAATLALTAWALLKPAPAGPAGAVAAVEPRTGQARSTLADPHAVPPATSLPAHWPAPALDPASRSPFVEPQPVVVAPSAPPPPPPPPPPQPVANYRFWGRMQTPAGQSMTYLAHGDTGAPVAIEPGAKLEDGWAVETMGDNVVVLVHSATNVHATVAIPPAAESGVR